MRKRKTHREHAFPERALTGEEVYEILIALLSKFPRCEDAQRASAMIWRGVGKDAKCKISTNCGNPVCFNPEHLVIEFEKEQSSIIQ